MSCRDCASGYHPPNASSLDACGVCLRDGAATRDKSCVDCRGVLRGGALVVRLFPRHADPGFVSLFSF